MVDAHDRERQNIWFRDPYGSGNRGYITFWADAAKLHGGPDTLDTFDDWVEALAAGLSSYLGSVIIEFQAGALLRETGHNRAAEKGPREPAEQMVHFNAAADLTSRRRSEIQAELPKGRHR